MLNNVKIENIQSHKNTFLEFSPGVNVLVGLSDGGKSAVLRAIRWAIKNRPQRNSFLSHWGGNSLVSIENDTCKVTRIRTKDDNGYILQVSKDKSDIDFKAIGTEVPEEVQKALNFDDINIQQQLDHPFLIDATPGEVAKHFNKVARLDVISSSTKVANEWVSRIDQEIKSKKRQLEENQEKIKQYDYINEMEGMIVVLENMDEQLTRMILRETKIMNLVESIKDTEREIKQQVEATSAEGLVVGILALIKDKKRKEDSLNELKGTLGLIQIDEEEIQRKNNIVKIGPMVNNVLKQIDDKKELEQKESKFYTLVDNIKTMERIIDEDKMNLKKLEDKFQKEFPNTCPLCGKVQ